GVLDRLAELVTDVTGDGRDLVAHVLVCLEELLLRPLVEVEQQDHPQPRAVEGRLGYASRHGHPAHLSSFSWKSVHKSFADVRHGRSGTTAVPERPGSPCTDGRRAPRGARAPRGEWVNRVPTGCRPDTKRPAPGMECASLPTAGRARR